MGMRLGGSRAGANTPQARLSHTERRGLWGGTAHGILHEPAVEVEEHCLGAPQSRGALNQHLIDASTLHCLASPP